jgi:hypothetical protein
MTATITIAWLHVAFVDYASGEAITRWARTPMQTVEACEIAASMTWENVTDIYCTEEQITVTRPKPRPAHLGATQ